MQFLDTSKELRLGANDFAGQRYRYMNFNEIAEFVEVAEKVEV